MLLPHEMMLSLAIWLVLMAKSTSATILRAKDSSPAMVTTENGETTTTATALLNEIQFPEDNAHGLLRRAQTDTAAGNETTINDGTNIDKIVSGTIVSDLNKYPFIAWPDIRNGGTFCGAILVSPGYLLTAAHCRGAFAGRAVFIGGTNIYGNDARDSVQAVKEIVHPSYNSNNNRYDFMLVRLQRSTTVSPVALNTNSNTPFNSGSAAIVIGYGRTTSTSGLSASLREAQVQTTTSCQNIFNVDLNVHVCAGPTSSTESPCMGDSGGPLLVNGVVVGVVSFGNGNCNQGSPAVYGRVSSAQTWIQNTICGMAADPASCEIANNDDDSCFSGSNSVEVKDRGVIFMHQLQIGDYVKAGIDDLTYSRVYSFAHLDRQADVEYLQIYVEATQPPIEISKRHLLYMGDGTLVPAEMVRTGDKLVYQGKQRSVVRIQTIKRHGLYHPVTESGDIVVSGVRASTYASVLGVDSNLESFVTHLILSPLRMACRFNFAICKNEEYTVEGFSTTINVAIQLAFRISHLTSILRIFWLIILAPAMVLMLALGNMFCSFSCVVLLVLLHMHCNIHAGRLQPKANSQTA